MEIRTCEAYVLARLEEVENELEFNKSAYRGSVLHVQELERENKALTKQLERAAEQMAELESQLERVCRQYNELAAKTGTVIHDFEPVREAKDGE